MAFLLLLFLHSNATAQPLKWLKTENDTTYITDYTDQLTTRVYLANKQTKYTLGDYSLNKQLSYSANDNYNIGLGFNYKYIGLNIGFKMPFVNDDAKRYGKTKFFDFQSFIYLRKLTVDLYCLSHRGYYLASRSVLTAIPVSNIFPQRPDIHITNIGLNTQYIFNSNKFSFRAAFLQNEHQKRSAGSLMAGAGVHNINIKADSAIIPGDIKYSGYFGNSAFTRSNITSLAVNGGYAHTLVIKRNYFITAALLGGVGINYTTMTTGTPRQANDRLSLQLNGITRLAAGYNSERYFIGAQYINFINRNNSPVKGAWQQFQTSNVRLTFAMRFKFKKSTKREINKIESAIKEGLGIEADSTGIK